MAGMGLERKPNLRGVVEMVRGGFFLTKKPLGDSASHYTNSAFAIKASWEWSFALSALSEADRTCGLQVWGRFSMSQNLFNN